MTVIQTMKKFLENVERLGEGYNSIIYYNYERCKAYKVYKNKTIFSYGLEPQILRECVFGLASKHPNLMHFDEVTKVDGKIVAVMPFMMHNLGLNLPLSQQQLKSLIEQLFQGLNWIHTNGFMHGNIKPINILYDQHNHLCITDFGLTRKQASVEVPSPLVGTSQYRAPETLRGQYYNSKADVYALGVTILQMILKQKLHGWQLQSEKETAALTIITQSDNTIRTKKRLEQLVKGVFHQNPDKRPTLQSLM